MPKLKKIKCDILSNFQTMCARCVLLLKSNIVSVAFSYFQDALCALTMTFTHLFCTHWLKEYKVYLLPFCLQMLKILTARGFFCKTFGQIRQTWKYEQNRTLNQKFNLLIYSDCVLNLSSTIRTLFILILKQFQSTIFTKDCMATWISFS